MWASEELRKLAQRHMQIAKRSEKNGEYETAINHYNKVIEILQAYIELYPNHPLSKTYRRDITAIKNRISQLEIIALEKAEGAQMAVATPHPQVDKLESKYILGDDEKPKVRWEDVVGLEDAKRSIIESIVYPSRRPDSVSYTHLTLPTTERV